MSAREAARWPAVTSRAADCVLSGELDLATVGAAGALCRAALTTASPDVVVDVAGVTFIDCAGLAPLLELARDVRSAGGHVTLSGAGPAMRRLLGFAGLLELFGVPPAATAPGGGR
jgi:anti-anti-sigma factor